MKLVLILAVSLVLYREGLAWSRFMKVKTRSGNFDFDIESEESPEYYQERWFPQIQDHYNPMEIIIWYQRYYVNDQFYKKGGPIFLMVSGEQVAHPQWLDEDSSLEAYFAKKFGAKLFFLEHRYYGMSRPTQNLSADNIIFLSTDQAMLDTAYFIQEMQHSKNVPRDAKWILFGASYAGSLVAWMRAKYPHLVHGAVANSAPLLAEVDFKEFYMVVQNTLKKHSPECVKTLSVAYNKVHAMLQDTKGRQKLQEVFKVCGQHFEEGKIPLTNDVINFYEAIIDITTEVVFNNDSFNLTIEKACNVLANEDLGDPLNRLAEVNKLLLQEQSKQCVSVEKYNDTITGLQNIAWSDDEQWDRRWTYQTCTEFGWYQTTTARPFGIPSDTIPVQMYRQLCNDIFGSRKLYMLDFGVERTNLLYGGKEISNTTSNIIFVHGSNDPWHAAGVTESHNPKSPVIFVEGGGHSPLIYPPKEHDSPQEAKAKQLLEKYIDLWLKE